jgi:hypothetical protein
VAHDVEACRWPSWSLWPSRSRLARLIPTSPLAATSSELAACQAYDVQYQSQSGSLPPVSVPSLFQLLGRADNATLRADGKSMRSEVKKVGASNPSSPQRTQATAAFNAVTRSVTDTCRAMGDAPRP